MPRILSNNSFTNGAIEFVIHTEAKAAIDYFHAIPALFDGLNIQVRDFLAQHSAIRGILINNLYFAIDPVWVLKNWRDKKPPPTTLITAYREEELTSAEIRNMAWSSVLSIVFNSIDRKSGLAKFQDACNEYLPPEIIKSLTGSNKHAISNRQTAKWTGSSNATVPQQRKSEQSIKENIQGDLFGEYRSNYSN
jgi:hypothetical protein